MLQALKADGVAIASGPEPPSYWDGCKPESTRTSAKASLHLSHLACNMLTDSFSSSEPAIAVSTKLNENEVWWRETTHRCWSHMGIVHALTNPAGCAHGRSCAAFCGDHIGIAVCTFSFYLEKVFSSSLAVQIGPGCDLLQR